MTSRRLSATVSERLGRSLDIVRRLPWITRIVWRGTRHWTLAWFLLLVAQGLLPVALVKLTQVSVDSLLEVMGREASWDAYSPALIPIALLGGVILLGEVLKTAMGWVRVNLSELLEDELKWRVHEKAVQLDVAYFEDPEFYDRLHRARSDAGSRPLALLESTGSLLQNALTLLGMAALLVPYGWWLPPLLLVAALPALVVVLSFAWREHRWWERTTPDRRRAHYFDLVVTQGEIAPELRLFHLGEHFRGAYRALRRRLRGERLELARKEAVARLTAALLAVGVTGAVLFWMVWRTLQGRSTPGDLILFYQAFSRGQGLLNSLLGDFGQIYRNGLFLNNLYDYLHLEPRVPEPSRAVAMPSRLEEGIRFREVTFTYPAGGRPVLENFSLVVPAGRMTAIVGGNGAGKSTLFKLICRFYDVEAGAVEFDGLDVRRFPLEELRRRITMLFQWPVRYQASVRDNVAFGDLASDPTEERIREASLRAGADSFLSRLPRGYQSLLGKWFAEGTELSGGEWQKVALARAFLRESPVMLLDEPTSFMDSWAEIDWLTRFRELARHRTTLVITHRFTTAMIADVIHVMEEGAIVESGSHRELVKAGGRYAQSWRAQMAERGEEKATAGSGG